MYVSTSHLNFELWLKCDNGKVLHIFISFFIDINNYVYTQYSISIIGIPNERKVSVVKVLAKYHI